MPEVGRSSQVRGTSAGLDLRLTTDGASADVIPSLLLTRHAPEEIPPPVKQELVRVPAAVAVGVDLSLGDWVRLSRRRGCGSRDESGGGTVLATPDHGGESGRGSGW